jgi:hypothetical protein
MQTAEEAKETAFVALPRHSFDEQEWTPVDSSYGAAFPCCGWLSHENRRTLKWSLLVFFGAVLMLAIMLVPLPAAMDDMVYRVGLIVGYSVGGRYMTRFMMNEDDD